MRKKLLVLVLILVLFLVGCVNDKNGDEVKDVSVATTILLKTDKKDITANGIETVAFIIEVLDQFNVLMPDITADLYKDGVKFAGLNFATVTTGNYKFKAKYGTIESNEITINVKEDSNNKEIIPVYLSVVIHYEESFNTSLKSYSKAREDLLNLAKYLNENNIIMNIQPDWAFLKCIIDYDDVLKENTDNKNILKYLKENLRHEIDPHAHEKNEYNIADIAYLISQTGIEPSNIVGGLVVDPVEDSKYNYFLNSISGRTYTDYSWKANILWGDATSGHTNDTFSTGVWYPDGAENFYTDKGTGTLPCIGKYINTFDGIYDLVDKSENKELDSQYMYTGTVFIEQGNVEDFLYAFQDEMARLKELINDGKIVFSSLQNIYNTWEKDFNKKTYVYTNNSPRVEKPIIIKKKLSENKYSLKIVCNTEGATIRYHLGKGLPNYNSTEYLKELEITETETIKVKAFKDNYIPSEIEDLTIIIE